MSNNAPVRECQPGTKTAPTLNLSERDSEILHAEVRGSTTEFLGWLTGMKPPNDKEAIPPEMRPAFNLMCQRLADAAVTVGEAVLLNVTEENATLQARVDELNAESERHYNSAVELGRRAERAESRVDELIRALKATREQLIKVRDASPEICNHELETNQVIAQAWHTLNDTGVAMPLEDRK